MTSSALSTRDDDVELAGGSATVVVTVVVALGGGGAMRGVRWMRMVEISELIDHEPNLRLVQRYPTIDYVASMPAERSIVVFSKAILEIKN